MSRRRLSKQLFLFEIPIYRCSPEAYQKEVDKEIARIGSLAEGNSDLREHLLGGFYIYRWKSWRYNQAVGWFQLIVVGAQITAECFLLDRRILLINRSFGKKRFQWYGKAFELHPDSISSSGEIQKLIEQSFKKIHSERRFKRRYIDLEAFHTLGRFIDWRAVLGFDRVSHTRKLRRLSP